MCALYERGKSIRELSERFKLSRTTIWRLVNKEISLRRRGAVEKHGRCGKERRNQVEYRRILKEDSVCSECGGVEGRGRKLSVHHLDGNRYNNEAGNTVIMCASCHVKLHWVLRKRG